MDGGAPILLDPSRFTAVSTRTILGADLFCGAGGTSTGMQRAISRRGMNLQLVAVNHWPVAVATHSANHRDAAHFCQDLATLRPLVAVPSGRLDILVASPTCTYHSRARGGRPTSDQQRMDPWHVVTWLTELRVARLAVENVPEFVKWGPVDPETGRPIKEREGEFFRAWIRTLESIGFVVDWKIVNCAEYGDATTRQRFMLVGRSDGLPLRRPTPTHGRPGTPGRKPWRVARDIIDWSNKGRCVFGRPTPLKPNTLRRIMVGVERHFGPLAPAYLAALEVELARSIARWGDKTTTKAGRRRRMPGTTVAPAVVELRGTACAHPVDQPVPGITAGGYHLAVVSPGVSAIVGANRTNNVPVSVNHPIPTIVTSGSIFLATPDARPFTLGQQSSSAARDIDEPLMTVSTAGAISLTRPSLVVLKGCSAVSDVDTPAPTITGVPSLGVAEAVVFPVNQGHERARGIRTAGEPLPTLLTRESLGVATPMIAPYYGRGSGETCKSVDEPLDTVTTKGRFGLAEPILVQIDQTGSSGPGVRSAAQPIPTLVTKQNLAVAEAVVQPVSPFVSVYNGNKDGAPRAARSVDAPIPSITTEPRLALCDAAPEPAATDAAELERLAQARRLAVIDGTLCVLNLPFRMLGNTELARATSFPEGYRFEGKPEEVTKQIGNAVPVHTAEAHIDALFED